MSSMWAIPLGQSLSSLYFWHSSSLLFSRSLNVASWTPESSAFHPASLATPSQPPLSNYDLLRSKTCSLDHFPVYTNLSPELQTHVYNCQLENPTWRPCTSQTPNAYLSPQTASPLVALISGNGTINHHSAHAKFLVITQTPRLTHQQILLPLHNISWIHPLLTTSSTSTVSWTLAGAYQLMPRLYHCCTACTAKVDL